MTARVLVIKLGALGDFILAMGPFLAIRRHHGAAANITLLTTRPYVALGMRSGWFSDVVTDSRPPIRAVGGLLRLRRLLADFDRIYDLQTSDRSGMYFRLSRQWPMMGRAGPEWCGIARGCSHPQTNPRRDAMHTVPRQRDQLRVAGIAHVPAPDPDRDLAWLDADTGHLNLPARHALLAPGGSPARPEKRWPATRFAALAQKLAAAGVTPVVAGTESERDIAARIIAACPSAMSLVGATDLPTLAGVARRAVCAVGNDTGPMHLTTAVGCPSVVLYGAASNPALCGQRGRSVIILRRKTLSALSVETVWEAARPWLQAP